MTDWKSKWTSTYSTKWKKPYWYNKERITTWYNPNDYKSEEEYNKVVEQYQAQARKRKDRKETAQVKTPQQPMLSAEQAQHAAEALQAAEQQAAEQQAAAQQAAEQQAAAQQAAAQQAAAQQAAAPRTVKQKFDEKADIDYLFTFEKDEIIDCPNCQVRLKIPKIAHIVNCGKCNTKIHAKEKKTAKEHYSKIKAIEEEKKKRKSDNKDLIDCRKHLKIVVDKLTEENKRLTEENKRLTEKVSDLTKSLERERETEVMNYMNDLKEGNYDSFTRTDGRPSKNSFLL